MFDPFAKLRRIVARREELDRERDDEIRALLAAKERAVDIAKAAGLHVQRIYQIRDGRR